MHPFLVPMGPIDWLTTKSGQWLQDTFDAFTGKLMGINAKFRQLLVDNLSNPSFSLLEEKWFNTLYSETYGWLIIIAFVLPTLIGMIVILRLRNSKRVANMAKDAVGVALWALIVTVLLNILIWVFNLFHELLSEVTGNDYASWLTTLTPDIQSFGVQLLYSVLLGLSALLILANQYFVPFFLLLGLIAWAIRSWGTHRTQQFFKRVFAFGFASLFTKLIFLVCLTIGNLVANGKSEGARAAIGSVTLILTLIICVVAFVGGMTVATKSLDGSQSEVEGEVVAQVDNRLSVEGDVNADIASMFSAESNTPAATVNDNRLAASQGDLLGHLADAAASSRIVQSLAAMDGFKTANKVLDSVPDEAIVAAGSMAGAPQAGAVNAARREVMSRVQSNPD